MRERLRAIMARTFQIPLAELPEDASVETVAAWDSLLQLELMLELELEFGVRISSSGMLELVSLDAIEHELRYQGIE